MIEILAESASGIRIVKCETGEPNDDNCGNQTMDERSIFLEALNKVSPHERAAFLNEACGDEPELRRRVEILLAAHEDAGSFLEKQPEEFFTTVATDGGAFDNNCDAAWRELLTPSNSQGCIGMLGQYEILELIGRGGMGVVLHAYDQKLKRTVAIKLLAPELAANPMSVRRFLREAQAAAAVSHDHVVTIHAIDQEVRPPFIVMEYVAGQSLQQKIDEFGALDVTSILRIGMQTAAGLAAAHRQGLVHRDVKPSNVLLENGIERVKLSDFGLARAVDDVGVTRTGQITGTPQYMSPEQAQAQRVDHRSDLFSLGCVLYAMCTGRAAFRTTRQSPRCTASFTTHQSRFAWSTPRYRTGCVRSSTSCWKRIRTTASSLRKKLPTCSADIWPICSSRKASPRRRVSDHRRRYVGRAPRANRPIRFCHPRDSVGEPPV